MNKIKLLIPWILSLVFTFCFEVNGKDVEMVNYDDYLGDLGVIVVTPTRTPYKMKDLPTNINLITREEIEASGAQNVAEAIENASGIIEVKKIGTLGAERRICIRGGGDNSKQVLVMIDGCPVNEIYRGDTDLSKIPVDNIERIEVIRGPASALYGPNALGGVVNIITKKAEGKKPVCNIYSSFGNFNTQIHRVNFGVKRGSIDTLFTASKNISDGWRDNSGCDNHNFTLRLGCELGKTDRIVFRAGYFTQDLRLPGYDYKPTPNASLDTKKLYGVLEYVNRIGEESKIKTKIYANNDEKDHQDPDDPLDTASNSITTGVDVQLDTLYGITVGGDIHQDSFKYKDEVDTANNIAETTQNTSVFMQNVLNLRPFTAILGCRYDYNSAYGDQINPRLSGVYTIRENLKISITAGRAFRAPSFGDLYAGVSGMGEGNPDLKPERAWGYDFGLEHQLANNLLSRLTLFRNDIDNFIAWAPSPDDPSTWFPNNIGKVYNQGVEIELKNQICKGLMHKVNYTYLESEGKITDKSLNDFKIKYGRKGGKDYEVLKYTPKHRLNYAIMFNPDFGLAVNLNVALVDKRWNLDGWDFNGKREKELPGYSIVNAGITQKISDMELFMFVDNIFDKDYRARWEYPLPGRTFRGGINLKF